MSDFIVAVVGATGAVGRELVQVLESRIFPISELRLFATKESEGDKIEFQGKEVPVEQLSHDGMEGADLVFFAAGEEVSREFAPAAADQGAVVVDSSAMFRLDPRAELVVPEVNGEELRQKLRTLPDREGLIVSTPNCTVTPLAVVLKPILERVGIKRVVVSTYQSVSGAGQKGIDELSEQVIALFNNQEANVLSFPHRIAFNCIPQVGVFLEDGDSTEERSVVVETQRILSRPDLAVSCTAVRIPTFSCHGESVNIEFQQELSSDDLRELLRSAPGVVVVDEPQKGEYPMNSEIVGADAVYVGRIRRDHSVAAGVNLWIVTDNLRKGMAVNMVQIAEVVTREWGRN